MNRTGGSVIALPSRDHDDDDSYGSPSSTLRAAASIAGEGTGQPKGQTRNSHPSSRTYLLTGLLRCDVCGGHMVGDRDLYVRSCGRRGHSRISSERVDRRVLAHLLGSLLSPTHFDAALEATRAPWADEIRSSSEARSRLGHRLSELKHQIDRLAELRACETIRSEVLETRIRRLEDERVVLEAEAGRLRQIAITLAAAAEFVTEERIQDHVDRFRELATGTDLESLRDFLGNFVERVDVEPSAEGRGRPRSVLIHGKAPGFPRTQMASSSARNFRRLKRLGWWFERAGMRHRNVHLALRRRPKAASRRRSPATARRRRVSRDPPSGGGDGEGGDHGLPSVGRSRSGAGT